MKTATISPGEWVRDQETWHPGLVLSFADRWIRPEVVGRKGDMLARLFQADLPAPDGMIILPAAFDGDYLSPNAWQQVQAQLVRLRRGNPKVAFAVRPSALDESATRSADTGAFETVLNVKTDEQIQEAIEGVYQSRKRKRILLSHRPQWSDRPPGMAVIVQRLVWSASSGVLFTSDIDGGQPERVVILATWGWGRAAGERLKSPDILVVDKRTGSVLTRVTAEKRRMMSLIANQRQVQTVPEDLQSAPVISHRAAAELASLGIAIEALCGAPVEVEWLATEHEKIYIVQVNLHCTSQAGAIQATLP